jgi:hypothetical protein
VIWCIFTTIEPLGSKPDDDANEYEDDRFYDRQDYYIQTEVVILSSMEPEMRNWFYTTESNSMIGDLKHHFPSQVRLMIYDRLDEFHALKMEEHTTTRKMAIGEIVFHGVQKFLYATIT